MVARPGLADLDAATRDALARGIREFNNWRFYDCHETLEDVWREVGSKGDETTLADFERLLLDLRPCLDRIVELGPERLREFDRAMIPRIVSAEEGRRKEEGGDPRC